MPVAKGKMVAGGRVLVPVRFRRALGLAAGDAVIIELRGEELRLRPARAALQRIQARVKRHAQPGRNASDELIAERRREAAE